VALPDRIQVRISSEAAGTISMTPVVAQTILMRDLVETILATTGKDNQRVRELLLRGAVVQGASRFRWQPVDADESDVDAVLRTFPNPDPKRSFRPAQCIGVRIRAGLHLIEVPRKIASERRLLKRQSFWDALLSLAAGSALEYVDYSYRTRTDEYRLRLTPEGVNSLQQAAALLRYSGLAMQIREGALEWVNYSVRFPE
jgi:hypothetical protein